MANATQVIRNVRPMGGAAVDVLVSDAKIDSIAPAGSASRELPTLAEGNGQLLLPALVEPHVHLDKTLWSSLSTRFRPLPRSARTPSTSFQQ
jgi:cytosine deaminase